MVGLSIYIAPLRNIYSASCQLNRQTDAETQRERDRDTGRYTDRDRTADTRRHIYDVHDKQKGWFLGQKSVPDLKRCHNTRHLVTVYLHINAGTCIVFVQHRLWAWESICVIVEMSTRDHAANRPKRLVMHRKQQRTWSGYFMCNIHRPTLCTQ